MAISNNKICSFLEDLLPTKTFVITTKNKTKFVKITSLMQLFFITLSLSFAMFCSVKYRIYTNNNDVSLLMEENEILKRENKQYNSYYMTIADQVEKINEYLGEQEDGKKYQHEPKGFDKVKERIDKKISLSYRSLNARKQKIIKAIQELGLERLAYNRIQKVVKIDSHSYDENLFASNGNGENIGGQYEPVKEIQLKELKPIISLPTGEITSQTFKKDIQKMIVAEKFIKMLPVGKPMKSDYRITSKFGVRNDPFEKSIAAHRGIDIVIADKKIYAPADGIVVSAGQNTGYGNMIAIEHNLNKKEIGDISIMTRYGHLDSMLVAKGDMVKKGQLIAIEGSTGRSTAAHLHFETIINKQHFNPVYFIKNEVGNV